MNKNDNYSMNLGNIQLKRLKYWLQMDSPMQNLYFYDWVAFLKSPYNIM